MSDELNNLTEAEWAALLSNSPTAPQLDQPPAVVPAAAALNPPQSHAPLRIGPIAVVPSILNRTPVNAPAQGRAVAPSETIPNFVKQVRSV